MRYCTATAGWWRTVDRRDRYKTNPRGSPHPELGISATAPQQLLLESIRSSTLAAGVNSMHLKRIRLAVLVGILPILSLAQLSLSGDANGRDGSG